MKSFHAILHGFPEIALSRTLVAIDGVQLSCLQIPPEHQAVPLAISFEEAAERLESFRRLHFEPDGAFVWVADESPGWQLDGTLYDRGDSVSHVELKGTCAFGALGELWGMLCPNGSQLVCELVPAAVFLDFYEFFRHLGALE